MKSKLQKELAALRRELDAIDEKKLSPVELKKRFSEFNRRRAKVEDELVETLFAGTDECNNGVWFGVRRGMLSALRGMEQSLERGIRESRKNQSGPGFLLRFTARLTANPAVAWICTVLLIYLLLLAVGCLGSGFKAAFGGTAGATQLFQFATNPFMGLIVGLLATALIQSSSTTTSIIVALCAAGMPVQAAIPMVMGANVGTSVTNTLVSLGCIGNRREFRRAFAAATVHDFFNLLAIVIFLPLELCFHILEQVSGYLAGLFYGGADLGLEKVNVLKPLLKPVEKTLAGWFHAMPGPEWCGNALFLLFGIALIFFSILLLGKILRNLLTGRAEKVFHYAVGRSPVAAIGSGLAVTVLVQSSSTTTSLIVPLAGSGVMTLAQVYPFTLGANIGTCVTALLAAMAITGAGAVTALQIALVHFLFNTFGVILIYGIKLLREIPLWAASSLARIASRRKALALGYVIGVFFLLPLLCVGIYRLF